MEPTQNRVRTSQHQKYLPVMGLMPLIAAAHKYSVLREYNAGWEIINLVVEAAYIFKLPSKRKTSQNQIQTIT
jgi:hypothetical protein|tara:strand:+ start:109 stop:327 length:219 start_codon:yes stop_codon:yes gene_type:complete